MSPDLISSRHCSEQGHTEGASFLEWKAFLIAGCHIAEVTFLSLEVHAQTDRPTKCSTTHCRHCSVLSDAGAGVAFL